MSRQKSPPNLAHKQGQIRIIGGQWRGRKLSVLDHQAVRPTSDRARETLFNWLAPTIIGARCLDLFAGSGVLALEAISRGAASATLLEIDRRACEQIERTLANFQHPALKLICADALNWLPQTNPTEFDLVFLDPPFTADYLGRLSSMLAQGWLSEHAMIYFESAAPLEQITLPTSLKWHKSGRVSKVYIGLAAHDPSSLVN